MIIIIHFNVFHVTCLSLNKQKLSLCDRKCCTGDNTCRPKIQNICMWDKSMSPHKTQKQCFICRPKILFVPLENKNCVHGTKTCCMGDIKLLPKNTEYMCDKSISPHKTRKQCFCATRVVPYATNLSPKNTETQYGRHQFIARVTTMSPKNTVCISATRTCPTGDNLVTQKSRNCVSATNTHKHCKFINIST